eukprot:TRINITY_DN1130_c4_g1_i1.p1 TRINITY_DN1130_c4_g1~~TRINITY_DN1130_c4_g1_i1.p1  ORF type:complete len:371 (+),score=114.20 TRINITY_DN1130_c4_g1_i1:149-1114(+)
MEEGLCVVSQVEGKEGVLQLDSVARDHERFRGFKASEIKTTYEAEAEAEQGSDDEEESEEKPLIVELFRAPPVLHPIVLCYLSERNAKAHQAKIDSGGGPAGSQKQDKVFLNLVGENNAKSQVDLEKTRSYVSAHDLKNMLFSIREMRDMLWCYVKAEGLQSREDPSKVVVNSVFNEAFFKKKKITDQDSIPKKDLNEKYFARLQKFHQINRPGVCEVKNGMVKNVEVILENRQGGRKHITHIVGLEHFAVSPEELASRFRSMFAASTSVQKAAGKGQGKELLIQGDVSKKAVDELIKTYSKHQPQPQQPQQQKAPASAQQ